MSVDKMYATNLMAILVNLRDGQFVEPRVPEHSALLFHADWHAFSFMRLGGNDLAPNYDFGCLLAIHKEGVADVYVIGLYNDKSGDTERFDISKLPPEVKENFAPTPHFG